MDYLLAHGITPAEPDAELVDRARKALLRIPLAELAYQRLREEAGESGKPPFTFRAAGRHLSNMPGPVQGASFTSVA